MTKICIWVSAIQGFGLAGFYIGTRNDPPSLVEGILTAVSAIIAFPSILVMQVINGIQCKLVEKAPDIPPIIDWAVKSFLAIGVLVAALQLYDVIIHVFKKS